MKDLDAFYLSHAEPVRGCLLALRTFILRQDPAITVALKYGMPFFSFRGIMFCYLWVQKKDNTPYVGFVEGKQLDHPGLIAGDRSRMKIFLIDPASDLPVKTLAGLVQQAISLYGTELPGKSYTYK